MTGAGGVSTFPGTLKGETMKQHVTIAAEGKPGCVILTQPGATAAERDDGVAHAATLEEAQRLLAGVVIQAADAAL